jgi:hypothetical protein
MDKKIGKNKKEKIKITNRFTSRKSPALAEFHVIDERL